MDAAACQQFLKLEKSHWWFEGRRNIFFHVLRRELKEAKNLRILDVGCGVGGMMGGLSRFGQPMGVDLEEEMLKVCQERGFLQTMIASGVELPFPENSFDLVTFFDCIEHIPDDRKALRETYAKLKPGGHVFISVPAYQFLYANNDKVVHHQRRYTRRDLTKKAKEAGFEIRRASHFNVILFPMILPAVLLIKAKERLFGVAEGTTNLTYEYPRFVHRILGSIFSFERHLISKLSFPVGHSICMIARKPK